MPKNTSSQSKGSEAQELPFIVTNKAAAICVVAAVILLVSGIMWWKQVYNHPRRVFEGMLNNSLSLNSITRSTVSDGYGGKTEKVEQLSFVPDAAVRTWVAIDQPAETGSSKVKTETIGTRNQDFSRYLSIETSQTGENGKKLDYSSALNTWGRTSAGTPPEYYAQAILGIVPFAQVPASQRAEAVKAFSDSKVYEVDYSKVEPKRINGKSALVVPVKVHLKEYLTVFKKVAKDSGLNDFEAVNPDEYADSEPVEVSLTIDKISRNLLAISYAGEPAQVESFSGHGQSLPIKTPEQTILLEQLQQKLQSIK